MRDTQLYARILGVEHPWRVKDVELDLKAREVRVRVEHGDEALVCPECGKAGPGYDRRTRRWRHLDTCQYRTILIADVPRVECVEHGVKQIAVAWSESGSRFTALFESLVIDWLRETSVLAVSRQLGLSWDEADTIQQHAVDRGLRRRKLDPPRHVGVDETSARRGHRYVTVVSDRERSAVLYVRNHSRETGQVEANRSDGAGWPTKWACTACSRKSKADRLCWVQVAMVVQIRSHHRRPDRPRVPCVTLRSITMNRMA